jgi:predicted DNA-binding protein
MYTNVIQQERSALMAMLSFRITDDEKASLSSFAEFHGTTMSKAAREIIIKHIEDEEDYQAIEKYRESPNHKTYTIAEMREKLGL